MFKIFNSLDTVSNVKHLYSLQNLSIGFTTELNDVMIFDYTSAVLTKIITSPHLDADAKNIIFSSQKELLAFSKNYYLYILDIKNNTIINIINTNNQEIVELNFDPTANYIFVATKSGRVFQYKAIYPILLSRICSFDKELQKSYFAFHEAAFACSSQNGIIVVINIYTKSDKKVFIHNKKAINLLYFIDEEILLCAREDSSIEFIDIQRSKVIKTIELRLKNIKKIVQIKNSNFAIVCSDDNYLSMIDTKSFKIIHHKYIIFDDDINDIVIPEANTLIVALKNSKILKVTIETSTILEHLLLHNSLKEAYDLFEAQPMLKSSIEYQKFSQNFQNSYTQAIKYLIHKNRAFATQILDAYVEIPDFAKKIKELFLAFEKYNRFCELITDKQYSLAYAISIKHTPLQETPEYKKMEQLFNLTFFNATKYIIKKDIQNAKEILKPYFTVASKKPLINTLLTHNKEFIEFLTAIKNRNFKMIQEYLKKYAVFKEIPSYISLQKDIENELNEAKINIQTANITVANRHLDALEGLESLSKELKQLRQKGEEVSILLDAYERDDFKKCYELLDKYSHLKNIELGILLEKHWQKLIQKCENYAIKGEFKNIKRTLKELLKTSSRAEKIGELLKVSFHSKIENLIIIKDFFAAQTIIYSYLDIFGIDSEIVYIMKRYEAVSNDKLAITHSLSSRDSWRECDIIIN